MDARVGLRRKLSTEELDSWASLGLQGDPTSPSYRRSVLGFHWNDRCWNWNSSTLATWCKELTHWKRPWWWERLKAGGEGDDRGQDSWMASLTQWTWVWAGSPVHHQLPEPAQTHVHHVSDAIQPSHPLSSPSPPAFNLSQHQGLWKIRLSFFAQSCFQITFI